MSTNSIALQIKDRLDIVEYVSRYVPDLKKQGSLYKACCPFHAEKTPSFVVNPANQSWRCFGQCAEGGDIFNFAMKKQGWSFTEAMTELGRLAGVETRAERSVEQRKEDAKKDRLRGLLKTASDFYHRHLLSDDISVLPVREYVLLKRGFTMETLVKFQIGYAPVGWNNMLEALTDLGYSVDEVRDSGLVSTNDKGNTYDRFRNRLMIPIRDERGNVTGFGARALDPNDSPKYLNSPQSLLFDKSKTLFALDVAKAAIREQDTAVIVEGYMDAIQAHQAGYGNVVAQMGTAMTEAQLNLIVPRYAHKVILALDADAAGQNAMRRSLEVARQTLTAQSGQMSAEIRIMQIEDAKDPDDILRETPQLWQTYVDNAIPVADFVIALETSTLPPNASVQERQAVAARLIPLLASAQDNIYARNNLQKLARELRFDETDIFDWATRVQVPVTSLSKPVTRPIAAVVAPPPLAIKSFNDDMPPPIEEFTSNSEEPPPYFGEDVAPIVSVRKPSLAATPAMQSRHQSRAAEMACLRELVHDFDFYYEVSRKFRELFTGNNNFRNHRWTEFTPDDFGETDLRLLLTMLVKAHHQDEMQPSDYIYQQLDASLYETWERLLWDEYSDVHGTIQGRMKPEMDDILKQQERTPMTIRERHMLNLRRVLDVRDKRLRRELLELNFLLKDAPKDDKETINKLLRSMQETMNAQFVFQQGIEKTL